MFSEAFITQVIVLAGILAAFALSAATQVATGQEGDARLLAKAAIWFYMSGFSAVFAVIWAVGYFAISDAAWRSFLASTLAGSIGGSMVALLAATQLVLRSKYPGLPFLGLILIVALLPPVFAALTILIPNNLAYVVLIPVAILGYLNLFSAKD